jgi:hypothetical protein
MMELRCGLLKEIPSQNGKRPVPFYGYMGIVGFSHHRESLLLSVSCIVAGSGKSVLWYVMTLLSECFTHLFGKLNDHSRYSGLA